MTPLHALKLATLIARFMPWKWAQRIALGMIKKRKGPEIRVEKGWVDGRK
jgi:hypothetical protein